MASDYLSDAHYFEEEKRFCKCICFIELCSMDGSMLESDWDFSMLMTINCSR